MRRPRRRSSSRSSRQGGREHQGSRQQDDAARGGRAELQPRGGASADRRGVGPVGEERRRGDGAPARRHFRAPGDRGGAPQGGSEVKPFSESLIGSGLVRYY